MGLERLLAATHDVATPALVVDVAAVDRNIARASAYFAGHETRAAAAFQGAQVHRADAPAGRRRRLRRRHLRDGLGGRGRRPGGRARRHPRRQRGRRPRRRSPRWPPRRGARGHGRGRQPAARRAARRRSSSACLIEIDVGQRRCGLDPGDEDAILALARLIEAAPGLTFRGLQGYEGHAVLLHRARGPRGAGGPRGDDPRAACARCWSASSSPAAAPGRSTSRPTPARSTRSRPAPTC